MSCEKSAKQCAVSAQEGGVSRCDILATFGSSLVESGVDDLNDLDNSVFLPDELEVGGLVKYQYYTPPSYTSSMYGTGRIERIDGNTIEVTTREGTVEIPIAQIQDYRKSL